MCLIHGVESTGRQLGDESVLVNLLLPRVHLIQGLKYLFNDVSGVDMKWFLEELLKTIKIWMVFIKVDIQVKFNYLEELLLQGVQLMQRNASYLRDGVIAVEEIIH